MDAELRARFKKLDAMLMALLNTETTMALVLANPDNRISKEALYELAKTNMDFINSTISMMKEKEKEDEN